MSVQTVATDPWQLRVATAVYPEWWTTRYGDDAASTLAEVAANRGRLPVLDVLSLLVRGLTLRARSSMTFWLGILLIGLEFLSTATSPIGFQAERVWGSVLIHAGGGVLLAVPMVAGSAAWIASHRARDRSGTFASRLAALSRDAAAVLAFSAAGYFLMVVLTLTASGWPAMAFPDLGYTASFGAMTVSAFGVGTLIGSTVPYSVSWQSETAIAMRVLGFALAITLGILAMLSDWWQNGVLGWRSVTGSGITFLADYGTLGRSNPHIIFVTLGFAVLFSIAAIGITLVRQMWLRSLAMIAALTIVIGGSAAISGPLLAYVGDPIRPMLFRSASELHCAGTQPKICLWPEQDALLGTALRDTMTTAYRQTTALDLFASLPETLTARATSKPDTASAIEVYNGTTFQRDKVIATFAMSTIALGACTNQPAHIDVKDEPAAAYGLTLLLGGASDSVTRQYSFQDVTVHHVTANDVRNELGVHNASEARTAITRWLIERAVCPSR